MDKHTNNRTTVLIIAITCITMSAIFFFILDQEMGWRKWLLVGFFGVGSILSFMRYFIYKR